MLPMPLPSRLWPEWSNYAPRWTSVQSQNWSNEQRHSRVCLLLMAFTGWTEPALARSYLNCLTKKVVIVDTPRGSTSSTSKSTWASGLMRRRKPSCLPMARRLQSVGLMTTGLALLAAICRTSLSVKMEI